MHPVFFGSAITGAGVDALMAGLVDLLPTADGDADGAASRHASSRSSAAAAGEKIAYVRMFSGDGRTSATALQPADGPRQGHRDQRLRAAAPGCAGRRLVARARSASCGACADVQIGDTIGRRAAATRAHQFAPPTLETVVVAATGRATRARCTPRWPSWPSRIR